MGQKAQLHPSARAWSTGFEVTPLAQYSPFSGFVGHSTHRHLLMLSSLSGTALLCCFLRLKSMVNYRQDMGFNSLRWVSVLVSFAMFVKWKGISVKEKYLMYFYGMAKLALNFQNYFTSNLHSLLSYSCAVL